MTGWLSCSSLGFLVGLSNEKFTQGAANTSKILLFLTLLFSSSSSSSLSSSCYSASDFEYETTQNMTVGCCRVEIFDFCVGFFVGAGEDS